MAKIIATINQLIPPNIALSIGLSLLAKASGTDNISSICVVTIKLKTLTF